MSTDVTHTHVHSFNNKLSYSDIFRAVGYQDYGGDFEEYSNNHSKTSSEQLLKEVSNPAFLSPIPTG